MKHIMLYVDLCPAEIYHIVSKSSTANDAPTAQEIGESKTIKPAEVCTCTCYSSPVRLKSC